MYNQFLAHISANLPFLKKAKLLLAISGGKDSVALAYLLDKMQLDYAFAHCNFQLRGTASDKDEIFVKQLAQSFGITNHYIHFDTEAYASKKGISIQMAARELRYDWFASLAKEHKYNYILTAHHQDDVLETFLLNLVRGTGLKGLTGIPMINGNIVRTLLPFSRTEITDFCTANSIVWREDLSNESTKYSRNKLRHDVIPVLKEMNPNLMASFAETIRHLDASQAIIDAQVKALLSDTTYYNKTTAYIELNTAKWLALPNYKALLYEVLKPFGFTAWQDVYDLLTAQSGKQVFSEKYCLLKDRKSLFLTKIKINEAKQYLINEQDETVLLDDFVLKIETVATKEVKTTKNVAFFDKKMLKFPLEVRNWKKGDYFYPLGMQGKKKISKFFKDEKLSLIEKENIFLLTSANNVVWVVGKRVDNRYIITAATKEIVKLTLTKTK